MAKIQKNYRFDKEHLEMLNIALGHHNEKMKSQNFPLWSETDFIRFLIENWYAEGRKKGIYPEVEYTNE